MTLCARILAHELRFATGVTQGTCHPLICMDVAGAEAIFRKRFLVASSRFEENWTFHERPEQPLTLCRRTQRQAPPLARRREVRRERRSKGDALQWSQLLSR